MFNNASMPSLSDIAAVTRNNDGDGFGGNNGWWILIILFAICGGWGNTGWGGYGGGSGANGAITRADLCSEFNSSNLMSDIRSVQQDLIRQNNFNAQGFSGINTAIATQGYETRNAVQAAQVAGMQNTNALQGAIQNVQIAAMQNANAAQAQLADCCCQNREAIANVRYDMATNTNNLQFALQQMEARIIANDNANYRQLHDENVAAQLAAKDAEILRLNNQVTQNELYRSQCDQTATLIAQLRPQANPAYVVPNPCTGQYYPTQQTGCCQQTCC